MRRVFLASVLMFGVLAQLTGLVGCGSSDRPELGDVSGTVTLDGTPLSGVIILFKPDEGRPASAVTDEDGYYELAYRHGVEGTKVGPNTISFEWPLEQAGRPIPGKYTASKSELKETVEPGSNTFDFQLTSK